MLFRILTSIVNSVSLQTAHLKRYGGLVTVKHIESKAWFSSGTEAPTSSAEQFPFLHPIAMAKSTSSDIENEDDIQSYQYKIILLGDGAVGKTSIATRFSEEKFSQNYKQTVGVDFFMKRISVPRKDS
jgi:polynucleotide 5'-kinase involved in rRNA processing